MKKVFDQTVRDLKREVNKNVLKVPRVEQKVLDATSNEPWGPHGTVLADIAQASRNYHEYQMIMNILWKRINDTGKNWRHVYKALTVLEYLVAHGSERVIDEIREHAYQISTLSDFQYIDSGGRDQGSNVRKKSQSIVALVNDKERLIEVRQKAAANKDKYRSASSSGGMYRPGSGGYGDRYDDDRCGYRDDDRYGRNDDSYGREREWGYRDEERYGRNGDSNSRDGDRYEERYGRDGYKDDNQHGQRSRSSDRERERSFEDDGQYSSRSGGPKTDDSQDGSKKLARKFSEQNIGAPPSYEEAVNESRSPVHSERDGETSAAAPPNTSSAPASTNQISSPPPENTPPTQPIAAPETSAPSANQQVNGFDEFDPRGSVSASSANTINPEMDLLGSLALVIVPTGSDTNTQADSYGNSAPSSNDVAPSANAVHQPFGDPFGDAPFKAIPSDTNPAQPQISTSTDSLHLEAPKADLGSNFDFGDSLAGLTYPTSNFSTAPTPASTEFLAPELSTSHQNTDILAGILPSSGPSPDITSQPGYSAQQPTQPGVNAFGNFQPQPVAAAPQFQNGNYLSHGPTQVTGHGNYLSQAPTVPMTSHMAPQVPTGPIAQFNSGPFAQQGPFPAQQGPFPAQQGPFPAPNNTNFYPQQGPVAQPGQLHSGNFIPQQTSVSTVTPQTGYQAPSAPVSQPSNDVLGSFLPQTGQSHSTGSLATNTKPPNSKFETKSTVWADTLSRGLVNLNISGPKANPMADIGVDFDALNRKEKRMEKPAATPVISTVTMGKAMGSGSGIGRAGAGALRPPPNPMMGSGMGMGMGMGGGPGPGAGPYGRGMNNQPMGMGMGMGMGMNMGMGMGMGMNMGMGMGQGPPMQQPPSGFPPGSNPQTGYNPMMGAGYSPQQPYNSYR